jgi:FkbM family methyltransferase
MNALLRLVRRAAALPGLQRLTTVKPLLRFSFALRASLVQCGWRFALNELRPRDTTQTYALRSSDVKIVLRHHSPDVMVLDEVFSQNEYRFPDSVADALKEAGSPHVVDLGANIGLFGAFVLSVLPRSRIISVEVDPRNAAVHEATVAANVGSDWTLIRGAAGTKPGHAPFLLGRFAASRSARPNEAATEVEVIDVLPLLAEADFAKLDIEGGEWAILDDPRFRETSPRALVLEYHPHLCPDEDPHEAARRRLEAAGYEIEGFRSKAYVGVGLIWGLR